MTQRQTAGPTHVATFDVRSSAHDVEAFVDQIAALLEADVPAVIDLSRHDDHGNRIPLEVHRSCEEPARD